MADFRQMPECGRYRLGRNGPYYCSAPVLAPIIPCPRFEEEGAVDEPR